MIPAGLSFGPVCYWIINTEEREIVKSLNKYNRMYIIGGWFNETKIKIPSIASNSIVVADLTYYDILMYTVYDNHNYISYTVISLLLYLL